MKFCATVLLASLASQQQVTATSQDFISDRCFVYDKIVAYLYEHRSSSGACGDEIKSAFEHCDADEDSQRCKDLFNAVIELVEAEAKTPRFPDAIDAHCLDKSEEMPWWCEADYARAYE